MGAWHKIEREGQNKGGRVCLAWFLSDRAYCTCSIVRQIAVLVSGNVRSLLPISVPSQV